MTIKVVAIKPGFFGGSRVREGDTFDFPKKARLPKWVVEAKQYVPPKPAKKEPEPTTLSEIGKAEAKASKPKGAEGLV